MSLVVVSLISLVGVSLMSLVAISLLSLAFKIHFSSFNLIIVERFLIGAKMFLITDLHSPVTSTVVGNTKVV